jgi:7-carboxy-7-deazaguanine synthase
MSLTAPMSLSPASLPQLRRDLLELPVSRAPSEGAVPINDIGVGVQWLGAFAGTPAVYVRTQGCVVGCSFCDVKETWHLPDVVLRPDWKRRVVRWRHLSGEDVSSWCRLNYWQRHVVVSGGEPAMHAGIGAICQALIDVGYRVQLETSGVHEMAVPDKVWLTVSPKIGMVGGREVMPSVLGRANEIVYPVSRTGDFARLAQKVIPHISSTARVYLHAIKSGAIEVAVTQAAFANGYLIATGQR